MHQVCLITDSSNACVHQACLGTDSSSACAHQACLVAAISKARVHQACEVTDSGIAVRAASVAGIDGLVAVKVLNSQQFRNIRDVDSVRNELGVMQALRHPHIIDMLDVVYKDGKFYIILECANGGDVKDYIREQARLCQRFSVHAELLVNWYAQG